MKNQLEHLVRGIGEIAVAGGALSIAAGVLLTALTRLFDPGHWGLWVSPRIYPIAPLVALLGGMVAKEAWAFAQDHWRHARRT